MKISNIFVLVISFILFVSCESENDSTEENNSLIGEWILVKRNPSNFTEPPKLVKLEIFSDSTVVYSDSLLGNFWHGRIINESGYFGIKFNNIGYHYNLGENWFIDDSLKTSHFLNHPVIDPIFYSDTYIRNSSY